MRSPRAAAPGRLLVLAPNWLGDAVMALPLFADIQRAWPKTHVTVAARAAVAPLFTLVPSVHATVTLTAGTLQMRGSRGWWAKLRRDSAALAAGTYDAALLLPNSFAAAALVWLAGVPQRWGIARNGRRVLLTRAVPRRRRYGHQVEYYRALTAALGVASDAPYSSVTVPARARENAQRLLHEVAPHRQRFVTLAPGAAYGRAKQWLPQRFRELSERLAADDVTVLLVGAAADAITCREIARPPAVIDLCGRTDLPTLAALFSLSDAVISNDSGAMHLAAAVGVPVTAIFGPTNERRTAPLAAGAGAPAPTVITADVFCRPCMLRECPIDHRCMSRVSAAQVHASIPPPRAQ